MAKTSMIVKARRKQERVTNAHIRGEDCRHRIRAYNFCKQCGRTRGVLRFFQMCRICLRQAARQGLIPGLRKSSW